MNEETITAWLTGLRRVSSPEMWAVRWAQGGVAAGAQQIAFVFTRRRAEAHLFGPMQTQAQSLADQFHRGTVPVREADRHWVTALDALESFPGQVRVLSRQGSVRQVVVLEAGSIVGMEQEPFDGAAADLTLRLDLARPAKRWKTPWSAERQALVRRLRYCPVPVTVGRTEISRQNVFANQPALMNWMEPALGTERHFVMQGDPRQIVSPRLFPVAGLQPAPQRLSLQMTLTPADAEHGQARAWWIRHGALSGPVRLVGATPGLTIDILCPGDRPGLELFDWYEQDRNSLFPVALVLSVSRRLANGLDSMEAEARLRERPIDDLIRRGRQHSALRRVLPSLGRPYNALGGPFHRAVKAFSLRPDLELLRG